MEDKPVENNLHEHCCGRHKDHEDEHCCGRHEHHEHEHCCGRHEHHEHEHCCGNHEHHEHDHHVPGHPIDCQCELCHPHEAYCDICGESLENCTCKMPDATNIKKVYVINNLDCANCAAKMEYKIKEIPGVKYASVSFPTKQLRISAANPDALLPEIQRICQEIESDVEILPREGQGPFPFQTKIYNINNLDCANCAAKLERAINNLPEISSAQITFATGKLQITAQNLTEVMPKVQEVCDKLEEGVVIEEQKGKTVLAKGIDDRKKVGGTLSLDSESITLAEIIIGGILFIASEWLKVIPEEYRLICLVLAYIILGARIIIPALKNIFKGNVLDENFLMTIATFGAFYIKAYEEAVGVIFFYRIGEYFEHRAVEESRKQIMGAVDMRPEVVNLLVGDDVKVVPAETANVGDILLVRVGDRIPLDGVVVDGSSMIDTAAVTGEPVPVKKTFGDEVVSGCINTTGMLKIRVEKILEESMVTKILNSVENAASSKPQIDRFITKFARIYTPIVVGLAVLIAIVKGLVYGDWNDGIYTAATFLVISCPCALVLSVPLAFFSGIGAGSKLGILFKGGVALEALKNVVVVVMDKTGTITKGNFVVQKVLPAKGTDEDKLLEIAASAELVSTHPIALSLVKAAKEKNLTLKRPENFNEISGEGLEIKTCASTVLCGNIKLMKSFNVDCGADANDLRGTQVFVAEDGKYLGKILIGDTIKQDAISSIKKLKDMHLLTALLTGDTKEGAQEVAKEVGIDEVHAELMPQDKLTELANFRSRYGATMFVGDGINDAPVLAGADVGAAMGSGADAAIEAADVVFMNSEVSAIPKAIAIARNAGSVAWENVWFALVVKVVILVAGFFGYASMWAAVFADTGVSALCVLNSMRVLYKKY